MATDATTAHQLGQTDWVVSGIVTETAQALMVSVGTATAMDLVHARTEWVDIVIATVVAPDLMVWVDLGIATVQAVDLMGWEASAVVDQSFFSAG